MVSAQPPGSRESEPPLAYIAPCHELLEKRKRPLVLAREANHCERELYGVVRGREP
jgi:hypothetical protein